MYLICYKIQYFFPDSHKIILYHISPQLLPMSHGFMTMEVNSIEEHYRIIEDIGKGTYGVVQKCQDIRTGEIVALKRIKKNIPDDGFPKMTIREVNLLQNLHHENVVSLKKVLHCRGTVFLVFEYCEYDLYALLYMPNLQPPNPYVLVSIMKQFMIVLQYFAKQKVVHRDLKPANMFITKQNILKIGDFGLARELMDHTRYSDKVITQWYRPPELLLGSHKYGPEVDMWSAGCILYEMIKRRPLFRSSNERDETQLQTIFSICGTPTLDDWPTWYSYDNSSLFQNMKPSPSILQDYLCRNVAPNFRYAIPLLVKMLQLNPEKRIKPDQALEDPFFRIEWARTDPRVLPPLRLEEMHQSKAAAEKKKYHTPQQPIRPMPICL